MELPAYWLRRPTLNLNLPFQHWEEVVRAALASGVATPGEPGPLWAFLCWLCDEQGYVAHGTGQDDLSELVPRQSNDIGWFGNRRAVYASSDALWAMFFAVMDRPRVAMRVVNAAITVERAGTLEARYFFGADAEALAQRPFRSGWVYILPADTFGREAGGTIAGYPYHSHHCASLEAVRPAFKVRVVPEDFPFLNAIHAYDEEALDSRVALNPGGFPWVEVEEPFGGTLG